MHRSGSPFTWAHRSVDHGVGVLAGVLWVYRQSMQMARVEIAGKMSPGQVERWTEHRSAVSPTRRHPVRLHNSIDQPSPGGGPAHEVGEGGAGRRFPAETACWMPTQLCRHSALYGRGPKQRSARVASQRGGIVERVSEARRLGGGVCALYSYTCKTTTKADREIMASQWGGRDRKLPAQQQVSS